MSTRCALARAAIGLLLITGCGPAKLKEDRSYSMPVGGAKGFELPAISKAQKITAEFTSSGAEVTVLLFKASDVKDEDNMPNVDTKLALGQKQGKEGSLVVDVPANTATWLVVREAKKDNDPREG